jgi:Ni,Fe-hydrogenase I cytochrome b subunit
MWQDGVIASAQLAFLLAMVPTVVGASKPALATCAMTAVLVAVVAVTQLTLGLWYTFLMTASHAVLWSILAVQVISMRQKA